MEVYILDSQFRRVEVVDRFESLIWTERYKELGDFELVVLASSEMKNIFVKDAMLACNESNRVMVVENINDARGSDGKRTLKVTGRSLELILQNRVAMASLETPTATWDITDTPGNIARYLFDEICVQGRLNAEDVIPYITSGSIYPTDTNTEYPDAITMQLPPTSLYDAIKSICDVYDLGFRLVRNPEISALYFEIYAGSSRVTTQTALAPVVFSPKLDNLSNTSEFTTIENQKNMAYVYSAEAVAYVTNTEVTTSTAGFARKVLYVDATDLTLESTGAADVAELIVFLEQRGTEALASYRGSHSFDGEINKFNSYTYEVDYYLGDIVEIRNDEGFANEMRVTEQILSSNSTGEAVYPTLSVSLEIQPGSWASWDALAVWEDMDDVTYWEDQP